MQPSGLPLRVRGLTNVTFVASDVADLRRSVLGLVGEELPLQSQGVFDIIIAKNAVQFFPQVHFSV